MDILTTIALLGCFGSVILFGLGYFLTEFFNLKFERLIRFSIITFMGSFVFGVILIFDFIFSLFI